MSSSAAVRPVSSALQTRLSRLAELMPAEVGALQLAERDQRLSRSRREIFAEGDRIRAPRAVLSGWACHQNILSDGRRQILGFLLPGDLIGLYRSDPIASASILAITDVVTCPVPDGSEHLAGLAKAYASSMALEQRYLAAHVVRLGRLNAQERLVSWVLEAQERLAIAGVASGDRFEVPLTQELLADLLGLTSVHVNRTLQALRRDGLLSFSGGIVVLKDRHRLETMSEYRAARRAFSD